METVKQNSLFKLVKFFNLEYKNNDLIDFLSTIAVAKHISPNECFKNTEDINNAISKKYFELIYEGDIPSKLISEINELDANPKDISDFLFTLLINSKNIGYYDILPEYARELAHVIKLPMQGNVAALNCSGITILGESIKQNKFKGNVHLFSNNKNDLKSAFLRIYPHNQNIVLHLGEQDEKSIVVTNLEKFDFIYSMPPWGLKKNDPTKKYISQAHRMLNKEGFFFLFIPSGLLFSIRKKKIRELILNIFNIDAIFSLSKAFKPFSGVDSAVLLLTKSPIERDIYVSHLNFLDESLEDLKIVIEEYFNHKHGSNVQSISPLINQVPKSDLFDDFNVLRFNPKLQTLRKNFSKDYELKKLGDICEIIRTTYGYGSKDYLLNPTENSMKYVRIMDIKDGKIDPSAIKYVERKLSSKTVTQSGDILLSRKGTIGKMCIINNDFANILASDSLVILRPYKEIVDQDYLYFALQSEYSINQIMNSVTGTIPHLGIKEIRSLEIPLMPLSDQKRAVEEIRQLQDELFQLKKKQLLVESELKSRINGMFN